MAGKTGVKNIKKAEFDNIKAVTKLNSNNTKIAAVVGRSAQLVSEVRRCDSYEAYRDFRMQQLARRKQNGSAPTSAVKETNDTAKQPNTAVTESNAPAEDIATIITLMGELHAELMHHYKLCHASELSKAEQRTGTFSRLFVREKK